MVVSSSYGAKTAEGISQTSCHQEVLLGSGANLFVEHRDHIEPPTIIVRPKGNDSTLYYLQPRLDRETNMWFMLIGVGGNTFLLPVRPNSNLGDAWGKSGTRSTNMLFTKSRQVAFNPQDGVRYFIRDFGSRTVSSVSPFRRTELTPHTVMVGGSRSNQPDRHEKVYCDISEYLKRIYGIESDLPIVSFGLSSTKVGSKIVPGFRISTSGRGGSDFDTTAILPNFSLIHY